MKKRLTALAMAFAVTALAGCGTSSTNGSGTAAGGDGKSSSTDRITVAIWDNNQKPGIQTLVDDWSAQSGIKADVQVINWNEYWLLLESGASGGSLPDVFWMHSNNAQKYMENDLLLDLTDKISASDKIDMSHYYSDIADLYTSNGKLYAMPKDIDTIALWYNKTMFDEAGLAYPDDTWTWETVYENAKKLTKADGSQYGYALNCTNNQDSYYNAIYSYGGNVISEDKKTSGYDDPKTIEAMQVFEKMLREGICPDLQILSENGSDVLLQSGKVAMITHGSWMVPAFRDNEYTAANCDIAPLPMAPDGRRVSMYNGLGWAAAADGKNTEAAWSLIEYLGSKEAQEKQAQLGVTMSAYKGVSEAWKDAVPGFNLQAYLDRLDGELVFRPYSRNTIVWEEMANQEFKAVWTGESTMEDTCKKIAQSMNEILAEE